MPRASRDDMVIDSECEATATGARKGFANAAMSISTWAGLPVIPIVAEDQRQVDANAGSWGEMRPKRRCGAVAVWSWEEKVSTCRRTRPTRARGLWKAAVGLSCG